MSVKDNFSFKFLVPAFSASTKYRQALKIWSGVIQKHFSIRKPFS